MAKKKRATKPKLFPAAKNVVPQAIRHRAIDQGIDLAAIVEEIRPHFGDMTYPEVGELAGIPAGSVSNLLNGSRKPSLGMVAALAHASGGRLVVRYEPPKTRKR